MLVPAISSAVGFTVSTSTRTPTVGRNPANQLRLLRLLVYPIIYIYLQGFIHPSWLFRISSINSITAAGRDLSKMFGRFRYAEKYF